jgi:prepilin peptidase CpaA
MPLDLETSLAFALTALACLAAAIVDVRQRRIPNRITFPAMAVLLAVHGLTAGLPGLKESGLGLIGGFLVMLVPYLFRVLGAGDVKLMAAVGAGLGSSALLTVVLFTSLAGGAQVILWLACLRMTRGSWGRGYRVCYGPAIAAGALGAMGLILAGQPYLTLDFSLLF